MFIVFFKPRILKNEPYSLFYPDPSFPASEQSECRSGIQHKKCASKASTLFWIPAVYIRFAHRGDDEYDMSIKK